jgi:hypothetical protein
VPARRRPDANGCAQCGRPLGVSWAHALPCLPAALVGSARCRVRAARHAESTWAAQPTTRPAACDGRHPACTIRLAPAVVVVRSAEPRGRRGRAAASVVGIAQHDRDPSGVAAWAVGPCGRVPRVGGARAAL